MNEKKKQEIIIQKKMNNEVKKKQRGRRKINKFVMVNLFKAQKKIKSTHKIMKMNANLVLMLRKLKKIRR